MKWVSVPQPVSARLLDLDQRVNALVREAEQLESKVELARLIVSGRKEVDRAEFAEARAVFDATFAQAKAARQRADAGRVVAAECRSWIETLTHNCKLTMVNGSGNGADVATMQTRLKELRDELQRLNSNPPVVGNIAKKVDALVAEWGRSALPFVRGFHAGGTLDVRWPLDATADRHNASGCAADGCNALMMLAALNPDGLAELIMRAVREAQPLSHAEHAARRAELMQQVDELSYQVSAALDRAGEMPDVQCAPWHILGVKVKEHANNGEGQPIQVAV